MPGVAVTKPLFPKWSNAVLWSAMGLAGLTLVGVPTLLMVFTRTPYFTGEEEPLLQPVKFDHRHHARDDAIACVYCHDTVETSAYAGVPPTSTCMGCHSQIWTKSPELALVRTSYFERKPIRWARVNNLPDHVFFDHSIHVAKGVGCVTCHGRVDLMGQVYQATPLLMSWCLDCHREPAKFLRPRERVTDMAWRPEGVQLELGRELVRRYGVDPKTDCTGCHR
jgi:hypothetical protein